MGANPAARVPQDLGGADGGTVGAGATRACTHPGRPGRPPEQPDGRLAVDTSHGHHLVQEPVFLVSARALVPHSLYGGILPQAPSRRGALLASLGNRDF